MRFSVSKAALAAALLSTGLAVALLWQVRSLGRERAQLQQEKQNLAGQVKRLEALQKSAAAELLSRRQPSEVETAPTKAEPDPALLRSMDEKDASIAMLRQDLATARAALGDSQNAFSSLQAQSAAQRQQNQEQLAAERDHNSAALADLTRSLTAAESSLKQEQAKVAELQAANSTLKKQAESNLSSARSADLVSQLSDINRRREPLIREIASRYRDISSQYRSLSGAFDGRQNQQIAPSWNSAELSRIQNAIASQDEDLRRLDELNAQAALIEKKLGRR